MPTSNRPDDTRLTLPTPTCAVSSSSVKEEECREHVRITIENARYCVCRGDAARLRSRAGQGRNPAGWRILDNRAGLLSRRSRIQSGPDVREPNKPRRRDQGPQGESDL